MEAEKCVIPTIRQSEEMGKVAPYRIFCPLQITGKHFEGIQCFHYYKSATNSWDLIFLNELHLIKRFTVYEWEILIGVAIGSFSFFKVSRLFSCNITIS